MKNRWESTIIFTTVKISILWLFIGLIMRLVNVDWVENTAVWFYLFSLPSFPSLFTFIFLMILLSGMFRRQRIALVLYLVFFQLYYAAINIFMVIFYLADNTDEDAQYLAYLTLIPLTFSIFFLILGVRALPDFPAKVHGNWRPAITVLVVGILSGYTLILTIFYVAYDYEIRSVSLWSFFASMGFAPVEFSFAPGVESPRALRLVGEVVASLSVFAAMILLLRSVNGPQGTVEEHMATRRILLSPPSEDSLGYFATNDDRSIVFSDNGRAAVSFRVINGVCIAAGNPLGDVQSWPEAIRAFNDVAKRNGWIPAAASISEPGARAYADAGMRIMPMGDEAIIDTTRFDLKELAPVRKTVNALKRKGYTVRIQHQAALSEHERRQLQFVANQWRRGDERGFTMASGRVADPRDGRTVAVTALDPAGEMVGLLTFVPWGRRGLSLDVMRRHPDAPSGLTELMVAELAKEGTAMNIDKFSLNFVVLREVMEKGQSVAAAWWQKALLKLLVFSSRWWQIQSLYQSNVKYQPQWQARYLAVNQGLHTARMLLAFASGEGFLPRYTPPLPRLGDPEEIRKLETQLLHSRCCQQRLTLEQKIRRVKLRQLQALGGSGYPPAVARTHSLRQLAGLTQGSTVSVAGRIHHIRCHGGVIFADLEEDGTFYQVVLEREQLQGTCQHLSRFHRLVSRGDIVSFTGAVGTSRNGTASVLATEWVIAAKSLVGFPTHSLKNPHLRARQRHMDLATNMDARGMIIARAKVIDAVRQTLRHEEFMEAETPILQTIHGGANARPFRTHIRAYDEDLTLRIAPELYLKRMIVGGIPKVFELGRNFRNEGVDSTHNPEFTALEVYEAYGDWVTMRELAQTIIRAAAVAVHGSASVTLDDGQVIDLAQPWPVVPVYEAVGQAVGCTITPDDCVDQHRHVARKYGINPGSVGELVDELYEQLVEPATVNPTFYSWFPAESSPLARADTQEPLTAQRWDLVACGMELGTAYSELSDPLEQRERLTKQSLLAAGGDPEAMEVDEGFLAALEFGMPPTGGLGIGIDRLVMFLLQCSIREVLAFPFVKPEAASQWSKTSYS